MTTRPSGPPRPPDPREDPFPPLVEPRRSDRFLPAWLQVRRLRSVGQLRWIPGRRGRDPELVESLELESADLEPDTDEIEQVEPRTTASRLPQPFATALAAWRRHLLLRVVAQTVLLAVLATAAVGAVLAAQVGDQLLQARRTQADADAGRAAATFNAMLSNATVSNADSVAQSVREGLSRLDGSREDAGASGGILLLRVPGQPATTVLPNGFYSGQLRVDVVPELLREKVRTSTRRQDASISVLDLQTRNSYPGLIVGQSVQIPLAGKYELYFVSSLRSEEQTLASVQRLLIGGMFVLVLLLALVAFAIGRLVVGPVGATADAAERLADGHLDERVVVKGDDELARLGASFNDMADGLQAQIEQLEELSRVQQRFVSDVSHELRTPLTTMRMAGEVIFDARSGLPPAAERSAELLARQLDRFDLLLADLLEISRFDAGAASLNVDATNLDDLVEEVVEATAVLQDKKQTRVRIHHAEEATTAVVDRRRVGRILRNLVDNAIEHSEGRPIDVWLGADDAAAAVLVRDYGVGLDQAQAQRVFDKFWRADPARARTTGGTGLGLAISAEDALLHGGRLEVWGRPGRGAAFRLTLPRDQGTELVGSPLPLGRMNRPERQ